MDFLGGSDGKESVCNAGDPVQSLGQEDPLEEKEMATHSNIAWKSHGQGSLQSMGSQRATNIISCHIYIIYTCIYVIYVHNLKRHGMHSATHIMW